ncbi:MAG: hypothetical protein V4559_01490 [Pseudomonadota bacterium]
MSWWPGWNTAESAGWWSGFYFWFGIVALFVLGITEVISHRYGLRKDELFAIAERVTATQRATHEQEVEKQHSEEVARLHAKLQPRSISSIEHAKLVVLLKNDRAPKGKVVVVWKLFDEEAAAFGKQVISVLNDAGFDASEGRGPMTFGVPGQWIIVRDLKKLSSEPSAIGTAQAAFRDVCHIEFDGRQQKSPFPDDLGDVVFSIGAKS